MAFVARSPRLTDLSIGSTTGAQVGPGTYSIARLLDKAGGVRANIVPFGSGAVREPPDCHSFVPAPGTYIGSITWNRVDRCRWNVFRSRTQRFGSNTSRVNADRPLGNAHEPWARRPVRRRVHRPVVGIASTRGHQPTIPSIPVLSQSFGYTMAPDGTLQKRSVATAVDVASGASAVASSLSKTGAPDIGRAASRAALNSRATDPMPGPGQYDPQNSMRFDGKLPRLSAAFAYQGKKGSEPLVMSDTPGPFDYTIHPSVNQARPLPLRFQNFGARAGRVGLAAAGAVGERDQPGPGWYDIGKQPDYFRIRPPPVPFCSKAERFVERIEQLPGPQDYNVISPRKTAAATSSTAARSSFGTSTNPDKVMSSRANRIAAEPGPGDFDVASASVHSSKFRRNAAPTICPPRVARMKVRAVQNDGPAPGQYDIDQATTAFKRLTQPSCQFTSRSARFDSARHELDEVRPGPWQYDLSRWTLQGQLETTTAPQAAFASTLDRFATSKEGRPGPGHYNLPSTMIKKTFNATIDADFDSIPEDSRGVIKLAPF